MRPDADHPLLADEERAEAAEVLSVLPLHLLDHRRQVLELALEAHADFVDVLVVVGDARLRAVEPVERHGVHAGPRGELPLHLGGPRPAARATPFRALRLDALGVDRVKRKRPEHGVDDVRAHVADRPVAVADPVVPVVRVHPVVVRVGRVVVAHGRGTTPGVPVHARGRLGLGRTRQHRVEAVVEAPHLAHLPDRAGADVLHETSHALFGVSVVAHLPDHAVLPRGGAHELHLRHGERHRLLHVHVQALPHREQRSRGVVVVGRGDRHGVKRAAQLLQHLAVVVERGDLGDVRRGLVRLHHGADLIPARGVGLGHADDFAVVAEAVEDAVARGESHAPAAADEAEPYLAVRHRLRGRASDGEERKRGRARRELEKRSSVHVFHAHSLAFPSPPNQARNGLRVTCGGSSGAGSGP